MSGFVEQILATYSFPAFYSLVSRLLYFSFYLSDFLSLFLVSFLANKSKVIYALCGDWGIGGSDLDLVVQFTFVFGVLRVRVL